MKGLKGNYVLDPKRGIPYFAGYAFAYELFKSYKKSNTAYTFEELMDIAPKELINNYRNKR